MKNPKITLNRKRPSSLNLKCKRVVCISVLFQSFFLLTNVCVHAQQLSINNRSYLVVRGNAALVVKDAAFKNNGNFINGAGVVKFTGNADTNTINISGTANSIFKRLTVQSSRGVAVKSPVIVTDSISVNSGDLFSNGNLTLRSTATTTAAIAQLPVDGSQQATSSVKGNVTVERYVAAIKSWRLMAVPLSAVNAPTISNAWQEGVTTASTNANPNPGYGTHITGGSLTNGFDQGVTPSASIKYYNNTAKSWAALPPSPGTNIPITNYPGYFLYVRGDRGVNLMQGSSITPTNTVLRMKGGLKSGNQTVTVNAANFTVVGNPYASTVDFHSVTKNNVSDKIYIWDPKMSGLYGSGAYVTLAWNSSAGKYDATSSISPVSQYLESGQAVLVTSADHATPGTLTFKESDKNSFSPAGIFSFTASQEQSLRADLLRINPDNSVQLLDGVLCTYADENSNLTDDDDALKLPVSGENISILQNGDLLAVERHKTITTPDTMFLRITQMHAGNYMLDINLSSMDQGGLIAVLKDKFSEANNNISLNTNGDNPISFTVTADPLSYAANRFEIDFNPSIVLAVTFTGINAYKENDHAAVEWQTENESGIQSYDVQRSADGIHFSKIKNVPKTGTDGHYKITDLSTLPGYNYYRIRSVETNGTFNYSKTAKVDMTAGRTISIFPNPVTDHHIHIRFRNQQQGAYQMRVISPTGAVVSTHSISITAPSAEEIFTVGDNIAPGVYQLDIINPGGDHETQKLIIQ